MLRRLLFVLAVLTGLAPAVSAREIIKVGGYEFGPFVDVDPAGKASGLTLELIERLNAAQDHFVFQFVLTSPSRRYKDFEDHRFDMVLFESADWGWTEKHLPVVASDVFLTGGELYVAQAQPGRGQEYFTDLTTKRMVGILGYHYGFANFEADPAVLTRQFKLTLVNNNTASIELILKDRGDIAVVTDAYLKRYLRLHPEAAGRLLVSERFDQRYHHRALIRDGAAISVSEFNQLLSTMTRDRTLAKLWHDFGLGD